MEIIWTQSKWKFDELDHKRVEFKILSDDRWVHGFGQFLLRQSPEGLLSVRVSVDIPKTQTEREVFHCELPQCYVDLIQKHDDQAVAQFRLFYTS